MFNAEEWIGCGRLWNDDIPDSVKAVRDEVRQVPAWARDTCIPLPTITVPNLLASHSSVPSQPQPRSSSLTAYLTQHPSYSSDLPNALGTVSDGDICLVQTMLQNIPTQSALSSFRAKFNSAWISGMQSVVLPNLPALYWPLWMEHLLSDMALFSQQRRIWIESSAWLEQLALTPDGHIPGLLQQCRDQLTSVPWNTTVPGFSSAISFTTRSLAILLSYQWLDDEVMNAGAEYIMWQLGVNARTQIVNCFLLGHLRNMRARSSTYAPKKPRLLDNRIRSRQLDTFWMQLHINRNHWTLMKVDLVSRTLMYADPLSPSAQAPMGDVRIIRWWLETLLPGTPFCEVWPDFAVPTQHDSNSCGVIVLSILAAILLGYKQWSQDISEVFWMLWFLQLSEVYAPLGKVSKSMSHANR